MLPGLELIVVEPGVDAADDWISKQAEPGDLVLTADFDLAQRAIRRGARCLDFRGRELTAFNLEQLLAERDLSREMRERGQRTRGPRPFSPRARADFEAALETLLRQSAREAE
jgi:uncharacterized protein YaiI (UPF0178 family)